MTDAHDDPPSVNDHAFEPSDEWWSLCKHCNIAQAAHLLTHPVVSHEIALHFEELRAQREAREEERRRIESGGRVRIGYYNDDNSDDE